MDWKIRLTKDSVEYEFKNEIYSTDNLDRISHKFHQDLSLASGAPKDIFLTEIYQAKSQHGKFEWTITASMKDDESRAYIDHIELTRCPRDCELLDRLDASID